MKKLSEFVNFKNQLDLLSTNTIQAATDLELNKIMHLVNLENYDNLLDQRKIDIQKSFNGFELELTKVKDKVNQEIAILEKPEFQKSYTLYEGEHNNPAGNLQIPESRVMLPIQFQQA